MAGELTKLFVLVGSKFDAKGIKEGEKQISGMSKKINDLSKGFLAVSAVAGSAFTAMAVLAVKAAQAAGKQEMAMANLERAMRNAGTYTDDAYRSAIRYAGALQKVSTFGDEVIISAQAIIAQYGFQGREVERVTKATLDFAAAKGVDLNTAAELVAKSIGSSTNALTRYGVQVTGSVGSTQRLESAVSGLASLFGGAAQAQAATFSGRIKVMSNRIDDIVEDIGFKLFPYFDELFNFLDVNIIPIFEDWIRNIGESRVALKWFSDTIVGLSVIIRGLLSYIKALTIGWRTMYHAFTFQWNKIGKDLTDFGIAIKDVFVGTFEFAEKLLANESIVHNKRVKLYKTTMGQIVAATKQTSEEMRKFGVELANTLSGAMVPAFQQLIYNGKFAMDSMKTFFEGILEGFRNMLAQMLSELIAKAVIFTLLRAFTGGGSFIAEGATDLVSSMLRGMGFANGVRDFGGGLAMVGELGPELVSMPPGSNVYNNNDTEHILNNAGAMNITVNVDGGMGSVAEARRIGKVAADEIHRRVKLARRV
jgi:hypothetical protein